jgi:rfaE bifunctional protein nucleotidyltransferase chain/domain
MSSPDFHPATPEQVRHLRESLEHEGKHLVFTNGCFDLLHTGHVRYLQQARALGDALVVAINSDNSVRTLKGPSRPINGELDRAEVIAALGCVDAVVLFEEPRVTRLIAEIQPHVYAKGGDYTPETLDPGEKAALDAAGTSIAILSLVPGRSTTGILDRLQTPASSHE